MVIRKMNEVDFEEVSIIANASFDDFNREDFLKMLNDTNYLIFVAEENGSVCGFVIFLRIDDKLEIIKIATAVDKRGQGVATKLLESLENWGKTNQKIGIILEVNEKNLKARQLYDKVGFRTIHIRKKYYKATDDALIMEKLF